MSIFENKMSIFENCIIAILGDGSVILVKDGKNYKENEITLLEILDVNDNIIDTWNNIEEQEKCFSCDIYLECYQDNTAYSSDYNIDIYFENMRELI